MQAKYILVQTHQVIANLVRTFKSQNNYLVKDDPWAGIVAATFFAEKLSTTLHYKPHTPTFVWVWHDIKHSFHH